MKNIITSILLLLFIQSASLGQSVVNRSTGTNTLNDPRQQHTLNLVIPRYLDTTTANLTSPNNIGVDSCGAVIFTYADGGIVYVRRCSPVKHWAAIGTGSSSVPPPYDFIVSPSSFIVTGQTIKFFPTAWIGWNILFIRGSVPQSTTVPDYGDYYSWDATTAKLTVIAVSGGNPAAMTDERFQIYPIGGGGAAPSPTTVIVSPIPITGADFSGPLSWTGTNPYSITILPGYTIQVFWNNLNRYLTEGTEWTRTATGFDILVNHTTISSFDATGANLTDKFYISISN